MLEKMDFYAPIARRIIAPLWAVKERTPYLRHLKYLEKSQYLALEKIQEDQWMRLRKILQHSFENTEFYKRRFLENKATPEDIKTWKDFERLPFLTKEDIRGYRDEMVAENIPKQKLLAKKTSGSTGVSLEFFVDEDSLQWKRACTVRYNRWAGWDLGERVAAVWGNPEHYKNWRMKLRNILLDRYTYLDTLNMDEKSMVEFYRAICYRPPALLFGHAHSLHLFSKFLKEKSWNPPPPKGIISTAMVLHSYERQTIEDVFSCKVTNRYGCEEVSLIACECEKHQGLHINLDTLIVEVIRDGKQASPGEPGSIVVTDLTNYGMPFIRYKVGDVGTLSGQGCSCGRSFPMLQSIEGRAADYIVTPEGKYISGISLTENFAMLLPEIKQLQIIQDRINHLLLRIVKADDYNNGSEQKIRNLVLGRFGPNMAYDLNYIDAIPQELSGKYRFCISNVSNPFT
jgi:phenylacetate-CoA ligase